jgi:hypothetical protein
MSRRAARRGLTLFATSTLIVLASGVFGLSTASAATRIVGLGGWQVQSSAQAAQSGSDISAPGFPTGSWLHVRDDAGARRTTTPASSSRSSCTPRARSR